MQQLEYRWVQTGSLTTESNISSLSWNLEGTRLLTGGELLQLWHQNITPFQEEHSKSSSMLLFNLYVICVLSIWVHAILLLCFVTIIKLYTVMKINRLRTQEGVVTGHEENTSNVLQDCEFCHFKEVYVKCVWN